MRGAQGRGRRGVAQSEPYRLAGSEGQWALQGSNRAAGDGRESGGEGGALQEAIYRLVGMTVSGLAPDRAARVLRAIAAALEAEAPGLTSSSSSTASAGENSAAG